MEIKFKKLGNNALLLGVFNINVKFWLRNVKNKVKLKMINGKYGKFWHGEGKEITKIILVVNLKNVLLKEYWEEHSKNSFHGQHQEIHSEKL